MQATTLRPLVSAWFQGLFTPLLGVLFTFPSQYWFTIGLSGVFSLTRWCWHIQTEFLRFRLTHYHYIHSSSTGLSPSTVYLSRYFYSPKYSFRASPLSLATTHRITIVLFSSGYLDVSVPRVLLPCGIRDLQSRGFPHSDIHGLTLVCNSPWLFAAYHVLHRLREPRHPPYALFPLPILI